MTTSKEDKPKKVKMKRTDKLGYIGLGVCIDYFIFKPVRKLRPLWFISIGFALGAVYTYGIHHIINYVKALFV